jgi:NADPH-dependent 2,4-dienoyl-CoA reductase/sulfur reductase-like enzyme
MRHVIIGNGPAGVVAAETIRKHRERDEIVLIGDEPEPPYSRMAIPYLLTGNIGEPGTYLRKDPAHWDALRVQRVTGQVTAISVEPKRVSLSEGQSFDFDTCLIATGSSPMRPPIPGIESPFVHPCWTLKDARNIMQLARPGARVLQMGAGFIGCIIMEALALRGVKLTVVEMGDRMVPRMMGPAAGTMIRKWCEAKGVTVYTGTKVEAIEPAHLEQANPHESLLGRIADRVADTVRAATGTAHAVRVRFSDGRTEEYDLVIQATGVRPNIGFLSGSAIRCLQGVLVDERMQTSVLGVFAAGDCAEAFDPASGKTIVSAIQPNAVDQGYVAGMNMAGRAAVSKGVTQINVLDTLGLVSTSFGQWQGVPGGQHAELVDEEHFRYLRLEFDGDRVIGTNSLGMTEHVGVMRGLVERGVALGDWKYRLIQDPTRLMEAYLAAAQAQEQWQGRSRGSMK